RRNLLADWARGFDRGIAHANGNFPARLTRPVERIQQRGLTARMTDRKFSFPRLSLVVLVGASGSGKSTFARKHFRSTEVISSDYCRALVADDENDLAATNDAFDILHYVAGKRLAAGRMTVVDATNVKPEDRKPLVELARQYHCLPVAIVLNVP